MHGLREGHVSRVERRRVETLKPQEEWEKGIFHNPAKVGAKALSNVGQADPRMTRWAKAVTDSGRRQTSLMPADALRFNTADHYSKALDAGNIAPETIDALQADMRMREEAGEKAIVRAMRAPLPPKVARELLAAVGALLFTRVPSIAKLTEGQAVANAFGAVQTLSGGAMAGGLLLVRNVAEAMWPEFNWAPMRRLEDDVRCLVEGKQQAGEASAINLSFAATLWEDGLQIFENKANVLRSGSGGMAVDFADFIGEEAFDSWLEGKHETAKHSAKLLGALSVRQPVVPQVGVTLTGGGAGGGGAGGMGLAALVKDWRSSPFREACIFDLCQPGGCSRGADCVKADGHGKEAATDMAAVKAWVIGKGGRWTKA